MIIVRLLEDDGVRIDESRGYHMLHGQTSF